MKLPTRIIVAILLTMVMHGCSLRRNLTPLGNYTISELEAESCLLQRLTKRSRELKFYPGTGKPYEITFRIEVDRNKQCNPDLEKIDVHWKDLEIDEIPDMERSKIRLTGKADVDVGDRQMICQTKNLIISYSDEWYEVGALSILEFRPPEDPLAPILASKDAFRAFMGKFTDFLIHACL